MTRPSKLTDEAVARYVQAVGGGAFPEVAARYAGFSPRSLYRYLRGSSAADLAFQEAAIRAETGLELRLGGTLTRAAMGDPRWAAEMLARRFPSRWGRRPGTEVADDLPAGRRSSETLVVPLDLALIEAIVPRLLEASGLLRGSTDSGGDASDFEIDPRGAPDADEVD